MIYTRPCLDLGLILVLLVAGCGDNESSDTSGGKEETSKAKTTSSNPQSIPLSITLDGIATDWSGVLPLLEEVGIAGASKSPGSIDIQNVYFANDAEDLYVFIRCVPRLPDRVNRPVAPPKRFLQIFIDTDNDPRTGCRRQLLFSHNAIDGYDVMVSLNAPVYVFDQQTYVAYTLKRPDDRGKLYGFSPEIKGGRQTSRKPTAELDMVEMESS